MRTHALPRKWATYDTTGTTLIRSGPLKRGRPLQAWKLIRVLLVSSEVISEQLERERKEYLDVEAAFMMQLREPWHSCVAQQRHSAEY